MKRERKLSGKTRRGPVKLFESDDLDRTSRGRKSQALPLLGDLQTQTSSHLRLFFTSVD
jgi:hypothetical protein